MGAMGLADEAGCVISLAQRPQSKSEANDRKDACGHSQVKLGLIHLL